MLKISILAGFLTIALVSLQWLAPSPAQCVYCSPFPCYGSCMGDCLCLKGPQSPLEGSCVSLSRADVEELLAQGYQIH